MSRILVVEDDPGTLSALTALLQDAGYDVEGALTPTAALRRIDARCPDAIISDLVMPQMSGIEFLREVRARHDTCKSIFVLVTGHASVELAFIASEAGADECLCKPVSVDGLVAKLRRHGICGDPAHG